MLVQSSCFPFISLTFTLDAIIEARSQRISDLLEMCYKLVDRYESTTLVANTTVCTHDKSQEECDSLVYGCLIKGLQGLKLFPRRVEASEVQSSVAAFTIELRSLKCFTYPASTHGDYYRGHRSHLGCEFPHKFAEQSEVIVGRKEQSGVLEPHLIHIEEQKKK